MSARPAPRLQAAVFVLASALTAASLLGTALAPYLLVHHPLLLVAISPAAHHVVLAAANVAPLPLLVVATLRRALTGVGAFGVGAVFGRRALGFVQERQPRIARALGWVERLLQRFGIPLLALAPAPTLAFFAGVAEKRLVAVVPALLVGHTLWNTAAYYVGDALAAQTDRVIEFLAAHLLESTLLCLGVVVLRHVLRRASRGGARATH